MNTKQIISELKQTGLTHRELAAFIGCSKATVDAWSIGVRGSRPTMELGQKLMALYKLRCK